eukprot:COSAG01_NODE_52174_length_348_cov_1.253012_1_plen_43_part_10
MRFQGATLSMPDYPDYAAQLQSPPEWQGIHQSRTHTCSPDLFI